MAATNSVALTRKSLLAILSTLAVLLFAAAVYAGPYTDSAHGNTTTGVTRQTIDNKYATFGKGNCAHCHEQHASLGGVEPTPNSPAGPAVSLGFAIEQDLCFECHDANGPAPSKTDVASLFNLKTYKHGKNGTSGTDYMETYDNRHKPTEKVLADFDASNRHAECADCHNPHEVTAANPLSGATGLTVTNGGNWVSPSYPASVAKVTNRDNQYQICFKCHSDWAGFGTGTNQALEFNTNNYSYHNVEGAATPPSSDSYGNFNVGTSTQTDASSTNWTLGNYVYAMMPRYASFGTDYGTTPWGAGTPHYSLRNVTMICSDCHGDSTSTSTPQGVHGSDRKNFLKIPPGSPFTTWDNTISIQNRGNCWCFNCHDPSFKRSGFSGSDGELHVNKHKNGSARCMTCHIKIPHGWQMKRLVKPQNLALTSPYQGTSLSSGVSAPTWKASGTWAESSCSPHQRCN